MSTLNDAILAIEALRVMEAWGFRYITAAFVWVKTNAKSGTPYWGMGYYTRANAEVCLLGASPGFKTTEKIKSHRVHQIVLSPFEGHSKKPDEVRRRIVELLGDVPRIELFARSRAEGWDAWGDEVPQTETTSESCLRLRCQVSALASAGAWRSCCEP